jgi:lipopolysaccharide/colanic/teichoic acid biosynthesis glycosyltransferase
MMQHRNTIEMPRTANPLPPPLPAKPSAIVTPVWPEVDAVRPDTQLYLPPQDGWYVALKPTFDVIVAAVLTIPAVPLMLVAWLLTKIGSRGPGFYSQTRTGKNGREYTIVKIRSMYHNDAVAKNISWAKLKGDARITPVGKLLRATHLDELPQLINVLRGEMSLVGPRPERPEVIAKKKLPEHVPGYDLRHTCKPGVTGLAQVQLPADVDLIGVRHKVYYDLYYLANQSFWLDLRICAATVLKSFLKPETLRKWLFLPTREQVCAQFLELLTPPATGEAPAPQPAAVV